MSLISDLLQNLVININISQYCDVEQALTTSTTGGKDDEPLSLGIIVIIGFAACFVCMLMVNCLIFICEDTEKFYETYKESDMGRAAAFHDYESNGYGNEYTP